jgi:putative AdoMet-dependent methyltransferase
MTPEWQWDECIQQGTDYETDAEVEAYDARMGALRDVDAEHERILAYLQLTPDQTVLEIGTGTGAFTRRAAPHCRLAIGADVSDTMLRYAAGRAQREGLSNAVFRKGGFLTYNHEGDPVDAVVSQLALHHLPDPWKLIGLQRVARIMRPGAKLFLSDVVFADHMSADPAAYCEGLVAALPASFAVPMARHLRQEFSTFDWIMRQLLERAGFGIDQADVGSGFMSHYLCRRLPGEAPRDAGRPQSGKGEQD